MLTADAKQLITMLHRGGSMAHWWTIEGQQSFWWEVGKPSPLPGGSRNVYVGVHPTTCIPPTNTRGKPAEPRNVRSQIAFIASIAALYCEFDAKDFGGSMEQAEHAARDFTPEPSVIVNSGGGYHVYHFLSNSWPLLTDDDRKHAKALQAAWAAYAGSDPAVKDIARVLRVPGTYNYKYTPPRPVEVVKADYDLVYDRSELEAVCEHMIVDETLPRAFQHRTEANDADYERRYAKSALDREVVDVLRTAPGMWHDRLLQAAARLGMLVGPGRLDENEVIDDLIRACGSRSDVRDSERSIRDALHFGMQTPRTIPAPKEQTRTSVGSSAEGAPNKPEAWQPPLPFNEHNLPAFPVDVFPSWLRDYVEAVAASRQVPTDLPAMLALSVLATACQKHIMVVGPNEWQEPVNIYTVTGAEPGVGKSGAFKDMIAPLGAFEREQVELARDRIAVLKAQKDVLKAQLDHAKGEAAKAKTEAASMNASERVTELAIEHERAEIPAAPRLIIDDVSPEQLITMLMEQGDVISAMSPEGNIFSVMAGRYAGDGAANFDVYLKAHAGDTLRVDRKSRPPDFVQHPRLTMGLTVQPEVIRTIGGNRAFKGLGLLARLLYSLPASIVGQRDHRNRPAIPRATRETYHEQVLWLLRSLSTLAHQGFGDIGDYSPIEKKSNSLSLFLSAEASERLIALMEWLEPQLAPGAALHAYADWMNKWAGAILRIAGLLHMAGWYSGENNTQYPQNPKNQIGTDTFERALAIGQYLRLHAQAAFQEMGTDPAVEGAKRILAWVRRSELRDFSKRAAFKALQGQSLFKRAADLDPALELLVDYEYVRAVETGERRPGRPTEQYEVNPLFLAGQIRNAPTLTPAPEFPATYTPPTSEPHDFRSVEGFEAAYVLDEIAVADSNDDAPLFPAPAPTLDAHDTIARLQARRNGVH